MKRDSMTDLIRRALAEDMGKDGDITARATLPNPAPRVRVLMRARKPGIVSGVGIAAATFTQMAQQKGKKITVKKRCREGDRLKKNTVILEISGPADVILAAERTALNFIGRMSGIATLTAAYVRAVRGRGAKIRCTRKTTPTLRALEKAAVRAGGGINHRMGLYDAILIKDNHIAASGSVRAALQNSRAFAGRRKMPIEIEVDTLKQLDEVLACGGADTVLLDNMDIKTMRRAVKMAAGRVKLEASGGITLENIRAVAKTGVDFIAIGALTHSAPVLDIGLDFDKPL